jgi:Holliday junction resolvase RusA-like endonuclease
MKFVIQGRLDGLNEYTNANRSNRYLANTVKHKNQNIVKFAIYKAKLKKVVNYPVMLKITWYEQNKRRDIDNITFATKFIQDELVNSGIIIDDSQKYINKLEHDVKVDKDNPRIEVEIIEM